MLQDFADFELEPHQECQYDRLIVYDGDSAQYSKLEKLCGSMAPQSILSSGNQMYLVFESDASVMHKGFKATHSSGLCHVLYKCTGCPKKIEMRFNSYPTRDKWAI